ncbi:hypothetical protein [Streptomyces lanatus]|uniref:Uncharacterized protein n=1 Tax=Streptomyces lanatus TaxID=66900 RepID=A0ABV1XZG0_9ACTN|nr:hypothetical protein [Streptomyces lanatus]
MGLRSPGWLLLLMPLAVLIGAYVLSQRGRGRCAVRFTNLDLLEEVAPSRPGWRGHLLGGGEEESWVCVRRVGCCS